MKFLEVALGWNDQEVFTSQGICGVERDRVHLPGSETAVPSFEHLPSIAMSLPGTWIAGNPGAFAAEPGDTCSVGTYLQATGIMASSR